MAEIVVVPPYDPANPYPVLNPNAEAHLITDEQNSSDIPPYSEILATSDVEVIGAGSPLVDGIYTYVAPKSYTKGAFTIGTAEYPTPGVPSLAIMQGANVYYYADDADIPIGQMFMVGSFGQAPAPAVVALSGTPPAGRKAPKADKPKSK